MLVLIKNLAFGRCALGRWWTSTCHSCFACTGCSTICNRMKIVFRYEFTSWFVVIFKRIRFGVPPHMFFVSGFRFGRFFRFVGFLFKFGVDFACMSETECYPCVNLIIRAHTNHNPAIRSSASRRGFLFEGQYNGDHFLILSGACWCSKWLLNPSRFCYFALAGSFIPNLRIAISTSRRGSLCRAHWFYGWFFWMFFSVVGRRSNICSIMIFFLVELDLGLRDWEVCSDFERAYGCC